MSTTATTLIQTAMKYLGVLASGGSASSDELADGLVELNNLLASWSLESFNVPFRTAVSKTLTGAQSYTIGSGADINTTRPVSIESAYVSKGGVNWPVDVIRDREAYDGIHDKSITGIPYLLYYEPSVPTGTVFIYYVGDSAYTLTLNARGQLTSFSDLTTGVDLAPGYDLAIASNLCFPLAPMFEVNVSAETAKIAQESLGRLRRANRQAPIMSISSDIPVRGNGYDIQNW